MDNQQRTQSSFGMGSPYKEMATHKMDVIKESLRHKKSFKIFDQLSMSHEEKALKNNFGHNYDTSQYTMQKSRNIFASKSNQNIGRNTARFDLAGRKTSTGGGSKSRDFQGVMMRNNMSQSQLKYGGGDLGKDLGNHASQFQTHSGLASGFSSAQERYLYQQERLQHQRNRNEITQQKQETLNAQHQARMQQLIKKAEQKDKQMAKQNKEFEQTRVFKLDKAKEKYNQSLTRKNHLDTDLKHKQDEMNQKLLQRQDRAQQQIKKLMQTENYQSRSKDIEPMLKDGDQKIYESSMQGRFSINQVRLQKLNHQKSQDHLVPQLMNDLEQKVERANTNKERMMRQRQNRSFERSKFTENVERAEQQKERQELDTMGQVIGKHHKKQVSMKKKEKEDVATRMFNQQKKLEAEQFFKNRLDSVKQTDKEKMYDLQKKFQKYDEKYNGQKSQLGEYKEQMQDTRSKKDQNSAKKFENLSNQKMNYKFLMMKKMQDKTNRADTVALQNKILSETGYSNHRSKLIDQLRSIHQDEDQK